MRRNLAVLLCGIVLSTSFVNAEELGPVLGVFTREGESTKYNLMFTFGIEQWEENKLSTFRYQQWFFNFFYPDPLAERRSTRGALERIVIDRWKGWEKVGSGTIITSHRHSSSDGTLKFHQVDWKRGKLDFSIVFEDMSTAEVMLRMKMTDGSIYLESFKAVGIARGISSDSLATVEYKIPKYTYILNVPLEMWGLRSAEDKKWDDMLGTLSKEDQVSWERFKVEIPIKCKGLDETNNNEKTLKKILPNFEKRKPELDKGSPLTPEEKGKLEATFFEEWGKCLSKSSISTDGQAKIANEMKQSFRESFNR